MQLSKVIQYIIYSIDKRKRKKKVKTVCVFKHFFIEIQIKFNTWLKDNTVNTFICFMNSK